jgi:hypothetical protein
MGCPVHQSIQEVNMFLRTYENLWPGHVNTRRVPQDVAYLRIVHLERYEL